VKDEERFRISLLVTTSAMIAVQQPEPQCERREGEEAGGGGGDLMKSDRSPL
jgi:hypothetical protein